MFKQFRDGWKAPRITIAMNAAVAALSSNRIDIAETKLKEAYKLILDTTLPQSMHSDLILGWGLLGTSLKEQGQTELANRCEEMEKLLQARWDVGDFYRER